MDVKSCLETGRTEKREIRGKYRERHCRARRRVVFNSKVYFALLVLHFSAAIVITLSDSTYVRCTFASTSLISDHRNMKPEAQTRCKDVVDDDGDAVGAM